MSSSRRDLLRATATAGVGAAAALAGCSALPSLSGGDGASPARDWLYDPTAFADGPQVSVLFESPSEIDAASDHLHPDVRERRLIPSYPDVLASSPSTVDWALQMGGTMFEAPIQVVYGGSFDEETARAASAAILSDGTDADRTDREPVADLQTVVAGDDTHGAYRDGLAVSVGAADRAEFERLLRGAADGESRLTGVADGIGTYLDVLSFDHAAQTALGPRADGDGWQAAGWSYRLDGETTTVRLAELHGDRSAEQLREVGADVDGLREVSVESDGAVRWLEATADTDAVGLQGSVFSLLELPYA